MRVEGHNRRLVFVLVMTVLGGLIVKHLLFRIKKMLPLAPPCLELFDLLGLPVREFLHVGRVLTLHRGAHVWARGEKQ